MSTNILKERLDNGPVICAEGFLFEIERRGYMSSGEFVPMVSLDHPEVLENLHREFQHAGSDIVEAFTYNGHREKMRVIGKEELLEPLNRSALKIAKKVALDTPKGSQPNLMAGNISNSNIWKEDDKKAKAKGEEWNYYFNPDERNFDDDFKIGVSFRPVWEIDESSSKDSIEPSFEVSAWLKLVE